MEFTKENLTEYCADRLSQINEFIEENEGSNRNKQDIQECWIHRESEILRLKNYFSIGEHH